MPYIKKEKRKDLHHKLAVMENAGDLNYMITMLCQEYLMLKGQRYQTYNDIVGALEGAKLELYRIKIAPYENQKCVENGDVWL